MTETALGEQFEQFGPLVYVIVVKDRVTDTSRGFGYVKFIQFSHTTKAFGGLRPDLQAQVHRPPHQFGGLPGSLRRLH